MKTLMTNVELRPYQDNRKQIDQYKANVFKNQNINVEYPILNSLLGIQRISATDSLCDSSSIDLGNNPYHFIKTCYQNLNELELLNDIDDLTSLSLEDGIAYLDLLQIRLPFDSKNAERIATDKFFYQRIPARSIYSENLQRYTDKIQVIAIYDDVLKLRKEFPLDKIVTIVHEIYSSLDITDMSSWVNDIDDYNLSNLVCSTSGSKITWDVSNNLVLGAIFKNMNNQMNDFTNLFIDNTITIEHDQTFMNWIVDGSNLVAQVDISTVLNNHVFGSHFDSSFIILNDDVFGLMISSIKSYSVPVQTKFFLSNEIPRFFITDTTGINEFINQSTTISYGTYIYNLLKFYYGFDDELNTLIIRLLLAWSLKNVNEDAIISEVSQIIENITGLPKTNELPYSFIIKELESQLSMFLQDVTGNHLPVIYNNGFIDVTTSVVMNYSQTVDDIYTLIAQLNHLSFVYLIDTGYHDNLNMQPLSVIYSKDISYNESGYLCIFVANNEMSI